MVKRDYTFVYSSASVEALETLITEFFTTFDIRLTVDDLFYYGVFCKPVTYANYAHWDEAPESLEIPEPFIDGVSTNKGRLELVNRTISEVIKGETDKPDWMIYVEMEEVCNEYEQAPSTFLYLIPKDEKYSILGQCLIDFLYSPNILTTMVNE